MTATAGGHSPESLAYDLAPGLAPGAGRPSYREFAARVSSVRSTMAAVARTLATTGAGARSGAAEWLIDNRYIVTAALRQVERDMSPRFLSHLPTTDGGREPRVSVLATKIAGQSEGHIEPDSALRFVDGVQRVTELTTAELWALPTFLRLAVLEDLARQGATMIEGLAGTSEAEARLHDRVAACIGSLRIFATHDWKAFFESASLVERTLRAGDPAGVYPSMDFETRDAYRAIVEAVARRTRTPEGRVAEVALECAATNEVPSRHVGFALAADGVGLEAALGYRPPVWTRVHRALNRARPAAYFVSILSIAAVLTAGVAWPLGADSLVTLVAVAIGFVPALSVSVSVVNWLTTHLVAPKALYKLDLSDGIPQELRAVVAVPVLLGDPGELVPLVRQLEMNYEGNEDPNLTFVLLSDLADADAQDHPGDDTTLARAVEAIEDLNAARASGTRTTAPFVLLHRDRTWNPSEGRWMGWERKRGKLEELNRLILGADETPFRCLVGNAADLVGAPYVVTLDADTVLPPGAAARLIGTLAHPINQPRLADGGTISSGFTVLQPRIETIPTSAAQSRFARIFEADRGLDLYTHAISDVYQDLFGEGVFAGKGIYHVEAFHRSLEGRVPENRILSHDLFEGVHGRAGLASDVAVFEEYPPDFLSYTKRIHRWVRGDWQLLPWLLPRVPGRDSGYIRTPLSPVDRWKIADNLRRSLLFPSVFALLAAGWLVRPGLAWWWSLAAMSVLGTPVLLGAATAVRARARLSGPHAHFAGVPPSPPASIQRLVLALVFMPYHAWVEGDAIVRTLYRLTVSRRRLLEWTTAFHTERAMRSRGRRYFWRQMAIAPVSGAGVLLASATLDVSPLATVPFGIAWLLSPSLAHWIGQPTRPPSEALEGHDYEKLRSIARRTWAFFERFVGPEDHWLPPDNYQEDPLDVAAHRTSPTNVGLMALSFLGAHDLGYVPLTQLTASLSNTFQTLERLPRYRGHFLNWYDTRQLTALPPSYVSTVDSGNLAGCLVALATGLPPLAGERVGEGLARGVADTWTVLREVLASLDPGRGPDSASATVQELLTLLSRAPWKTVRPSDPSSLVPLAEAVVEVEGRLAAVVESGRLKVDERSLPEARLWLRLTHQHLTRAHRELSAVLPWLSEEAPPGLGQTGSDKVDQALDTLRTLTASNPTWSQVADLVRNMGPVFRSLTDGLAEAGYAPDSPEQQWVVRLAQHALEAGRVARTTLADLERLAAECRRFVAEMDFSFLYDRRRALFHIGYNLSIGELDGSYYDLLASEARLASFLAIAKGDVPLRHWLHLGRPFGKAPGGAVLLSWAGTMFEYLMPSLLMRTPERSLLGMSNRAATNRQIRYAALRQSAWGISESAYYQTDAQSVYQYRAFGVPDLGLRQDPDDRLVIAPYASLLALRVRPRAALDNLKRLTDTGMLGPYGLYEALDYGHKKSREVTEARVVRSYMAHHQGMILLALVNALTRDRMVTRFHASPEVAAADYVLFEQVPSRVRVDAREPDPEAPAATLAGPEPAQPWETSPLQVPPALHVLSNGTLSTLIGSDGSGGLRWGDGAVTRWRLDPIPGRWGSWVYLQDLDSRRLWSATPSPVLDLAATSCQTRFAPHMAEFHRNEGGIATRLTITIPPTADVEVRTLHLENRSEDHRHIRVATYAEMVLANPDEDRRHPAFTKLFVDGDSIPDLGMVVHARRTSDPHQAMCCAHTIAFEDPSIQRCGGWNDRGQFLGRGGSPARPLGLDSDPHDLAHLAGDALDPVQSLAVDVALAPGTSTTLALLTAVGSTRARVLAALKEYSSLNRAGWALEQARTRSMVQMQSLDIPGQNARRFQRLLSAILLPMGRGHPATETRGTTGQRALWSLGISGDLPILTLRVARHDDTPPLLELLRAHGLWESLRIRLDLVVLDCDVDGYAQPLRHWMHGALSRMGRADRINRPGGVHHVPEDRLGLQVLEALLAASCVVLDTAKGSLAEQIRALELKEPPLPPFVPVPEGIQAGGRVSDDASPESHSTTNKGLDLDTGHGGFEDEGRSYRVDLPPGDPTPAPWINVLAGPDFGALVSERGGGYTWYRNSAEARLTTWTNDPVLDRPGEALYLRDEETGDIWSPTPGPAPAPARYTARHQAGQSTFDHASHGLIQETRIAALPEERVRWTSVRIRNQHRRPRRITLTYYAEWVLGNDRSREARHIATAIDNDLGLLTATNTFHGPSGIGLAYLASTERLHSATCDRVEFLGHGGLERPSGLTRIGLSRRSGRGFDPCAALQVHVDLPADGEAEVSFFLGAAEDLDDARRRLEALRSGDTPARSLRTVSERWDALLEAVSVETPSRAMDLMVNRWLLYQSLSSRIWGRSGLYQSSGAFGFRDQLQDVLAFLLVAPELAREQILRAASHQFSEGDVLHWWHPPDGRGVRTRCSDDLLWLPYAVAAYVEATGDGGLLDELVPFLQGEPLREHELERFAAYPSGSQTDSVYEHCIRALHHAQGRTGAHGLPLIGTGDWNDSFDELGPEGRGESVWLAWFIKDVVRRFTGLMDERRDAARAHELRAWSDSLVVSAEEHAWDGSWYRRATHDRGSWIGSSTSPEGRIDSLTQSWAVISGGARQARAALAMDSVMAHLVDDEARLVKLLTPPFQNMDPTPGYARNYPPGVRENGGQYTHAAVWVAWALADLGDGDAAARVFSYLNPAERASNRAEAEHYRREPYSVAADVYGTGKLMGVGGWTWYTGSAAWLYRLAVERILGLRPSKEGIRIDPCVPRAWDQYRINLKLPGGTTYRIHVRNPDGVTGGVRSVLVDGNPHEVDIPVSDDGLEHEVEVTLGEGSPQAEGPAIDGPATPARPRPVSGSD